MYSSRSRSAPAPFYETVKQDICKKIAGGVWQPHDRIPSEAELVAQYGFSRMTINRALRELTDEGWLVRLQGVGTFVAEPKGQSALFEVRSIAEEIAARRHQHRCEVLTLERVRANAIQASALNVNESDVIFHSIMVHYENDLPVQIGMAIDGEMSVADWRRAVNPGGKYMPGKPAWYMFDNCQSKHAATIGVMCSAAFWSQNNGLQLQNLTIENTLGDSVDAGNHPAVALRTDGDKVQINKVNILGRQNTFFVTNSGVQNRLQTDRQPRTLVTNSYIEGDVDMVSGRGAVVFDNTNFQVVNSRTQQEAYVFAPATLSNIYYGFLAINSRFNASGDGVAQLGRSLDVDANTNGQVVIRDSVINEGFNVAKPWADAVISKRPFAGNTGTVDDKDEVQRNLNDTNYNRMWEYNNRGVGSKVVAEPKQ